MRTHKADESAHAITLMKWAEMSLGRHPELRWLFHVPNGGARSKRTAGRLKAEGVKAGVLDYILPVARGGYHGLYVELKADGRLSKEQRAWIEHLRNEGYLALYVVGWDRAREVIVRYLGWGKG